MNDNQNKIDPKKLKWWQWGLIAFVGLGIIGQFTPKTQTSTQQKEKVNPPKEKIELPDNCNQEIAGKYIDRWARPNSPVKITLATGEPLIVVRENVWNTLGVGGQSLIVAIVDCSIAGPNKHYSELKVVNNLGGEPYARFDSIALMNIRHAVGEELTKPPKE